MVYFVLVEGISLVVEDLFEVKSIDLVRPPIQSKGLVGILNYLRLLGKIGKP